MATVYQTEISRIIETDILNGTYKPGERLNERGLAARFNVSRTPVREALNKLLSEGLLERRIQQGVFVARVQLSTVFEMFEMLAILEAAAARLAARRFDPALRDTLLAAAEATVQAAQGEEAAVYTAANTRFHELIYAASTNRILEEQIRQLRRRSGPYRNHIHRTAGRLLGSAHEHLEIARAIVAGEEEAVAQMMALHLDIQRPEFSDYVLLLSRSLEA